VLSAEVYADKKVAEINMPAYVGKRSIYAKVSLDRSGVALSSHAGQAGHVEVVFAQSSVLSTQSLFIDPEPWNL
jgi:hypothetical protein